MSEKKTDKRETEKKDLATAGEEAASETGNSGTDNSGAPGPEEKKGGGGFMALLALVIAAGGLVAGYQALQQNKTVIDQLAARTDRLESQLESQVGSQPAAGVNTSGLTARLDNLEQRATNLEQRLDALPAADGAPAVDIEPRLTALKGELEQLLDQKVSSVQESVAQRLSGLKAELEQQLAGLQEELAQQVAALRDELQPQVAAVVDEVQALIGRETAALEKTIAALQAKVGELEMDRAPLWEAAEVEYLINIADDSLELRRDVATAVAAMRTAAQRLATLEHPAFAATRQLVADELQALLAVPQVDVSATAFTLARLQEQIGDLPLRDDKLLTAEPPMPGAHADQADGTAAVHGEDEPQWEVFLEDLGASLKGLVVVRRRDATDEPLLPPDKARFIGENLRLKLEAARLALLRGDEGVYHASLKTAAQWLRRYYQEDAAEVKAMLDTLAELDQLVLQPQLPSVKASLKAIREVLESRAFLSSITGPGAGAGTGTGNENGNGALAANENGAQAWLPVNAAPVRGGEES